MTNPNDSRVEADQLSDEEFDRLLQMHATATHEALLMEPLDDHQVPLLITHVLEVEDRHNAEWQAAARIYALPDFDMARRFELLEQLGAKIALDSVGKELVRGMFFVSEAWLSKQRTDEPRRYAKPEDDPNRAEVVVIAGMAADGRCNMARIAVTRDAANHLVPGAITVFGCRDERVERKHPICLAFYRGYIAGLEAGVKAARVALEGQS